MVSDKLMQEFRAALSPDRPLTINQLSHKLQKDTSQTRKVLLIMEGLGLVGRVELPHKRRGQAKSGWVLRTI
jgi:predicted transcriptional regulator